MGAFSTCIQSQLGLTNCCKSRINCLCLTSRCRHHNTVLGSKSCIRRTQCHQDALWRYGFFLPTLVRYKISTKANIQMMNRGEWSCTSNLHAKTSLPKVHSVARHWLCYIILVGQRECISSEHFSEGCLSRTRTVYLVILVQLMLMSWNLYSIFSLC